VAFASGRSIERGHQWVYALRVSSPLSALQDRVKGTVIAW
jgi:hypothetical protein